MRETSVHDLSPAAVRQRHTGETGSARGPTLAARRTRQMTGWKMVKTTIRNAAG